MKVIIRSFIKKKQGEYKLNFLPDKIFLFKSYDDGYKNLIKAIRYKCENLTSKEIELIKDKYEIVFIDIKTNMDDFPSFKYSYELMGIRTNRINMKSARKI